MAKKNNLIPIKYSTNLNYNELKVFVLSHYSYTTKNILFKINYVNVLSNAVIFVRLNHLSVYIVILCTVHNRELRLIELEVRNDLNHI